MAELILTDEEKELPFWNDLDDASLGRAIKYFGIRLTKLAAIYDKDNAEDEDEEERMDLMDKAATVGMACRVHKQNAKKLVATLKGVSLGGESIGDWRVTYEKISGGLSE
jgi:hypothetical protein